LLVAALAPPLGRTLVAAKVDERATYGGLTLALGANEWASGVVAPTGHRHLVRFALDGTTPVWTYACAEALLDKRVFMEPGANTTYVQWRLRRARAPLALEVAVLVDYRDYHGATRGGWPTRIEAVPKGIRVTAFDGAHPLQVLADGVAVVAQPEWYRGFHLAREEERGLEALEDHLRAAVVRATLPPGGQVTLVLSTETAPALDGDLAWRRREAWEADLLVRWRRAQPVAAEAPAWIQQLVLNADQFVVVRAEGRPSGRRPERPEASGEMIGVVRAEGRPSGRRPERPEASGEMTVVRRPLADDPEGMSVIAGYHWFGDWGRDTMIALPGLTLVTGRPEIARRILTTFSRFVDCGMLPNRFPDAGEAPEYNTADATLWYVEAVRAYHEATGDDALVGELYETLEAIVAAHRAGTRYGIGEDPVDGLLRAGEPGVQLTWMDAKVGDWVVTPRIGKPVEINALWYNALRAMQAFAVTAGRPAGEWTSLSTRVAHSFARFWCERTGGCYDVIDGPDGDDATIRPNQIFAVGLPASPLPSDRQRRVVETCARHLLTPMGLRSLAPGEPAYCGRYGGDVRARDCAYHQGAVWAWLLGPFALAWRRVFGDAAGARDLLAPLADHLGEHGLGSIAEIFDGDPPHAPGGCIAQAWSVAETLRAWHALTEAE
jgi:glycogen debranching enzyme